MNRLIHSKIFKTWLAFYQRNGVFGYSNKTIEIATQKFWNEVSNNTNTIHYCKNLFSSVSMYHKDKITKQ